MPPKSILLLGCCTLNLMCSGYSLADEFEHDFMPARDQFELSAYQGNYFLPWYYTSDPNQTYYAPQNPNGGDISKTNFQFQVSLKYGLASNLLTDNDGIYFSYTQVANWQAYDSSAYFRDTQYQPELFWVFLNDVDQNNWHWRHSRVGFMHQSNGKGGEYERSWNRFYLDFQFGKDQLAVNLRPWIRTDVHASRDYNPDIEDYLGYGDIQLQWKPGRHTIKLTLRNQMESSFSKGYEELSWQFPIYKKLHGYVKLQSGYGLTISDYNSYDNAIGIGVAL
ncbi:phospholipase A [Shewanella submarina]|uniref:Phospholipase A1 n=1 Tax=Shewanella submarina TaxID=2016376 RepID=A0ABV7G898_9GAMM|nr:phospholipase A [Shewanella submarina]MCL1036864.1 phospholipase A [Shewanella submarina]